MVTEATEPPSTLEIAQHNIVRCIPEMISNVRALGPNCHVKDIWSFLFEAEIINWTNVQLECKSEGTPTDELKIMALFGLFTLTSIYELFSTKCTSCPIFRAVMFGKTFQILVDAVHYDNAATWEEGKKYYSADATTRIAQCFINNCQKLYSLEIYACVYEMLIPFRIIQTFIVEKEQIA